MKNLLFLLTFLLFSSNTQAQTCHFCSEEDLISLFKSEELSYRTGYTDSGTKYYYIDKGFYKQIYYFYYDINTIYVLATKSEKYSNRLSKEISEIYTKSTPTTWSGKDFNIKFNYEDGLYLYIFEYK